MRTHHARKSAVLVAALAALLCFPGTAMASPRFRSPTERDPITCWAVSYGGDAEEGAWAVESTSDGGAIAVGYSDSVMPGTRRIWVIKTAIDAVRDVTT